MISYSITSFPVNVTSGGLILIVIYGPQKYDFKNINVLLLFINSLCYSIWLFDIVIGHNHIFFDEFELKDCYYLCASDRAGIVFCTYKHIYVPTYVFTYAANVKDSR